MKAQVEYCGKSFEKITELLNVLGLQHMYGIFNMYKLKENDLETVILSVIQSRVCSEQYIGADRFIGLESKKQYILCNFNVKDKVRFTALVDTYQDLNKAISEYNLEAIKSCNPIIWLDDYTNIRRQNKENEKVLKAVKKDINRLTVDELKQLGWERDNYDLQVDKLMERVDGVIIKNNIEDRERFISLVIYHMNVEEALKEYLELTKADRGIKKSIKTISYNKPVYSKPIYNKPVYNKQPDKVDESYMKYMKKEVYDIYKRLGIAPVVAPVYVCNNRDLIDISEKYARKVIDENKIYSKLLNTSLYLEGILREYSEDIRNDIQNEIKSRLLKGISKDKIATISCVLASDTYSMLRKLYKSYDKKLLNIAIKMFNTYTRKIIQEETGRKANKSKVQAKRIRSSTWSDNEDRSAVISDKRRTTSVGIETTKKRSVASDYVKKGRKNEEETYYSGSLANLVMSTKYKLEAALNVRLQFSPNSNIALYRQMSLYIPMNDICKTLNSNYIIIGNIVRDMLRVYNKDMRDLAVKYISYTPKSMGELLGRVATEFQIPNIDSFSTYEDRGLYAIMYSLYKNGYR